MLIIIIFIIIIIVQDTQKKCGPICFVEGKIKEHDFLLIKKQLMWLFSKTLKLI